MFLLLLLFAVHCMVHYSSHAPIPARGQNTNRASCVTGGSDPTELWAAESRQKWGRSRPIWCFFLCHFLILVSLISSFSPDLCASQGEEDGEDEAEVRNSYLLHLLRPNSHRAHRKKFLLGWSDPRVTLATEPCAKVGSLQPNTVFCPRSS